MIFSLPIVIKTSARLALPGILTNITVPMLGMIDIAIAGHLPSSSYIAALALGTQFFAVFIGCCSFLRMSTSAATARAHGAKTLNGSALTLQMAFFWALLLGLLVLLLKPLILLLCLKLATPPADTLDKFLAYFSIRLWDAPAQFLIMVFSGWLIGRGKPEKFLIIVLSASAINIVLSLLFVFQFQAGISGIAWATFIASYAAAFMGLGFVYKVLRFRFKKNIPLIFQKTRIVAIFQTNSNLFIRSLLLQIAFTLFVVESSKFGSDILAVNTILLNFILLTTYGLDGFADAGEILIGRAKGQKSPKFAKNAIIAAFLWSFFVALIYTIFFLIFGSFIVELHTNLEIIRQLAKDYLVMVSFFPLIIVWFNTLDGLFLGSGLTHIIRNNMLLSFILFFSTLNTFTSLFNNDGIWLGLGLFFLSRSIILGFKIPKIVATCSPDTL